MKALLLAAIVVVGCGQKSEPAAKATPSEPATSSSAVAVDKSLVTSGRIALAKVEKRVPQGELRVPGEVRADEKARAEAGTLVSGRVASIEVALGARVAKGAVLAWVDSPEFGRAIADLLRARARAAVAARKLARQLELEKQDATSKNAVDDARAEASVAEADLAAARTAVATLGGGEPSPQVPAGVGVRLAVRAPIEGIVTKRDAVLGAPVSADKSLFEVVAPEKVHVVAKVPETVTAPAVGTIARIHPRGAASGTSCAAKTTAEASVVDEATRTRDVRVEPTEPCTLIVPGAFVDVAFKVTPGGTGKPEILVPRDALVDVHDTKVVFVTHDQGATFVPRTVRLGPFVGSDAIVEDGLVEGEQVVVRGAVLLKGELLRSELR